MTANRGYHDIGGLQGGPIDPSHRGELAWEKLSVAISNALGPQGSGTISVHQVRRAREEMGAELYNNLGYFEKSLEATARLLIEKGILTPAEIDARIAALRAKHREDGS